MKKTWIVVAHRAGAKFFEKTGRESPLSLVEDLPHAEGKLLNKDLKSDRPGVSCQSPETAVNAYQPNEDPREHGLTLFSNLIAKKLEAACYERRCDEVILIAEPHVMGRLNKAIAHQKHIKVTSTIEKDLVHCNEGEIDGYIQAAM